MADLAARRFRFLGPVAAGLVLAAPAAAQPARPAAAPVVQSETAAARAVLARLGVDTRRIDLALVPNPTPRYRARTAAGRLRIEGSSPVALVRGAARTLGQQGSLFVSWEGVRARPLAFRDGADSGVVASPFSLRAYLNTCTYGYTTPWWNWGRWEREIDWMAAHGVDTPLAMEGQEHVWRALWREQGMTDAQIADGLSAAPFLPWQRMGNIAGYRAPLSANWIEKKRVLQRQILARMRSLDMKPILPAFSGYVPEAFAKAHPEAKIYQMRAWEGFPGTYWLDPSDPLFAKLAARFLQLYTATYGPGEYYLADAFNEMVPPIAEDGSDARAATYGDAIANTAATRAAALPKEVRDARLASYGERLYRSITAAAPNATWVMQGWLFGADKAFWTPDAIAAFLSKVPDERMLILDIGNDRYPGIWNATKAFYGKGWAYGYVHNYGGSNPVYGDLNFYRSDVTAALANPGHGRMRGFGLFPEGLHSNGIAYAYAYDLAWGEIGASGRARPLDAWLGDYTRARYGKTSPALVAAWNKAITGAYTTRYWTPRWWHEQAGAYLLFKFPSLDGAEYPGSPGDQVALRAGIEALLAQAPQYAGEPLYTYDVVDLVRHYASVKLDERLKIAIAAYKAGDLAAGDRATAAAEKLAKDIDAISGNQQETLGSWLADAAAYGDTPAEKAAFVEQAKAVVTVWGGTGHLSDYASRAWQGLYAGYYWPRWQRFLAAQRAAAVAHTGFDAKATAAAIRDWQAAWLKDGRMWARQRPAAPLALARTLLAESDAR